MAVAQAMGKNSRGNIEEDELQKELNSQVGKDGIADVSDAGEILKVLFIDSNRNYAVDKDGNIRSMTWWETKDEGGNNYITNGEVTLQIGDYITYNANDKGEHIYTAETEKTGVSGEGKTFSSDYETNWRVLGIEHGADEDNLMIVPTTLIKSTKSEGLSLIGEKGYCYGIEEMENICKIYGYGTGAISARSITVEDINKITGYDPMNTGDGTVYKKGEIAEYKNEITYTRENFSNTTIQGKNGAIGNFGYKSFTYYDENSKKCKDLAVGKSITLTSTYYGYFVTTLTESSSGTIKGLSTGSREHSTLFPGGKRDQYWLASNYICGGGTFTDTGATGFFTAGYDNYNKAVVGMGNLLYAGNRNIRSTYAIMPIVYLDKNIQLKETGNQVNSYTEWEILEVK